MPARRWIITIAACLLLLAALAAYKFLQIRGMIAFAESFPEPSETVEPYRVNTVRWRETLASVGEVKVQQSVVLRNEVEGRVITVGFAPGDSVRKDQLLLQLDASEEIARLRAAEADAELASRTLARNEQLASKQLVSREQFEQARAQRAVALAQAEALRAIIAKKTLTAPFDGRAGLHTLQAGQFLAANTAITQLVGNEPTVWVDFAVPQQQAAIATGAAVQVSVRGVTAEPLAGTITAADPAVSTTSRNLMLRATVDNSAALLKPGMLVDVALDTAPPRDVLAVPDTAVLYDEGGSHVFLLQADEHGALRARRQAVTTAGVKQGLVAISAGLQGGEQVAANGAYKLKDGLLAHVKTATGTAP